MPALKGQCLWSKNQKPNLYADRGLDQFALVSAELQAARDILVAHLGTQLSLIRFTSGTSQQSQYWVPIIYAPTSSKAEARALRRAAFDLIAGGTHAFDAGKLGHHAISVATGSLFEHLGSLSGEYRRQLSSGSSDNSHSGSTSSNVSMESRGVDTKSDVGLHAVGKHGSQTGMFGYLVMATQRFLWVFNISVFGLRDMAALACKAIISKQPADGVMVRTLPSSSIKDKNVLGDRLFADMASSPHSSSQVQPTSMAQRDTKQMVPSRLLKISPESLGRALSGAGLVLVLGGLMRGFVPTILSVVCWWYMLPSMRKAIGDKPFVRSRYHHHGSQENKSSSPSSKEG